MQRVIFYTKEACSLCEDAEALLSLFKGEFPYELEKRDIYSNDKWLEEYHLQIPVIEIEGKQLNCEELNYNAIELLFKGQKGGTR
ncbi:glutaredoxin family protein [Oceanobacillus sp. CF4.6]|uniref:glutaredoxin family protein n=1 Tax=Oceanobacillus sp. CF4.6 TaxID=3373080 RepID=UPI003EE54A1D